MGFPFYPFHKYPSRLLYLTGSVLGAVGISMMTIRKFPVLGGSHMTGGGIGEAKKYIIKIFYVRR